MDTKINAFINVSQRSPPHTVQVPTHLFTALATKLPKAMAKPPSHVLLSLTNKAGRTPCSHHHARQICNHDHPPSPHHNIPKLSHRPPPVQTPQTTISLHHTHYYHLSLLQTHIPFVQAADVSLPTPFH